MGRARPVPPSQSRRGNTTPAATAGRLTTCRPLPIHTPALRSTTRTAKIAAGLLTAELSVSTPIVAGVFALAGNAASQDGGETFWEKKHENPNDLNPVLRGSDGYCSPIYLCTD